MSHLPFPRILNRRHVYDMLLGVLVATVTAAIINLPLWHALVTTNEWQWNDIVPESSDELFYLSRIREVTDGHPRVGNPYLYERRTQSYPLGNLWERTLALPMQIFGIRMKTLSIGMDAVLPFLLALITWCMLRSLLVTWRSRAVTVGAIFLSVNLALWKRPISPQATTLFLLLWMWLFLHPSRIQTRNIIARGVVIGLMVYSYPFHWTYALAAEAALSFHDIVTKKHAWRVVVRQSSILGLAFLTVAFPWILQSLTFLHDEVYGETLSRLGLITRHLPAGPHIQLLLLGTIACVLLVRQYNRVQDTSPLLALLTAGILALSQCVITGKEAEFSNHYERIVLFSVVIGLVYACRHWKKYARMLEALLLIAILWTTLIAVEKDFEAFAKVKRMNAERQVLKSVIEVLNTLPKESVILTENSFADTLVTYTSHYPFTSYGAYMYLAPDTEIVERARIYNALVPYEQLTPRGIFGTRYVNERLYARLLCSLSTLFKRTSEECNIVNTCRECDAWAKFKTPESSTVLKSLSSHHVTYVLLKHLPSVLHNHVKEITRMDDGRILYGLVLPR